MGMDCHALAQLPKVHTQMYTGVMLCYWQAGAQMQVWLQHVIIVATSTSAAVVLRPFALPCRVIHPTSYHYSGQSPSTTQRGGEPERLHW